MQDFALEILDMSETVDSTRRREQERFDRVKALVTVPGANIERVSEQFPEYFAVPDPFAAARTEDGGYDIDQIDDAEVEWSVADEDQDDEMSRWIAEQETGSASAADLGNDWV